MWWFSMLLSRPLVTSMRDSEGLHFAILDRLRGSKGYDKPMGLVFYFLM
jgi:hypothetical protein